ncbi:MAG TPA: SRPBCC family protein [Holophaga sp.]|nr:SRPBCC family protein [Holophaga sp.]
MALWEAEHTLDTSAEPHEVWLRLSDVSTWPEWDSGVLWAELRGPFATGTQGRLKLKGEGTRSFRLVRVDAEDTFTATVRLPLAEIRHIHAQTACPVGTRVTHRIEIRGPLAWFFGFTRGRRLREGLAPGLRNLARIASGNPGANGA